MRSLIFFILLCGCQHEYDTGIVVHYDVGLSNYFGYPVFETSQGVKMTFLNPIPNDSPLKVCSHITPTPNAVLKRIARKCLEQMKKFHQRRTK